MERVNGELQNTVIATVPRVSQFWKYARPTIATTALFRRLSRRREFPHPSVPRCLRGSWLRTVGVSRVTVKDARSHDCAGARPRARLAPLPGLKAVDDVALTVAPGSGTR